MSKKSASSWHIKLFGKSVLKQRKLKEILMLLGQCEGKVCLDLGSDNGVISYYLREQGGHWHSADLSPVATESILSLVGERVDLITGEKFPYPDAYFDKIVVVDMLEHVQDEQMFVSELERTLKDDGLLIINAPNLKRFSPLRGFRHLIGQTDEAHGHLRPGYNLRGLMKLFDSSFVCASTRTYSRFFSELVDTAIVGAYSLLQNLGGRNKDSGSGSCGMGEETSKGLLLTESDLKKFEKSFKLYSLIYPFVKCVAKLDLLIPFIPGFMRITALTRKLRPKAHPTSENI